MSDANQPLNSCNCCKGIETITPASIENLPGLSAIAYRAGTHGSFKVSMLAALSKQSQLRKLTTRDDDDPAIAAIDGCATVLDVLTFYQERIANEGFLRTATERSSVLELARSIGYELRPGVAAGTFLAFTLETAEGAPSSAQIPIGTKVQSTPAQDETPQIFETTEEIVAYSAWNEIKPRQTEAVLPKHGRETFYLKGTATNLKPGDAILIIGDEREKTPGNENWDFRRLKSVTPVTPPGSVNPDDSYTIITLFEGLGSSTPRVEPTQKNPRIYALRQRAALFGFNAPDWKAMPESLQKAYLNGGSNQNQWPNYSISKISGTNNEIHLDAIYPQIVVDSWIVLSVPGYQEVYRVKKIEEDSCTNFALSSKSTRLTLEGEQLLKIFDKRIRDTVVYAQSEELQWREGPISTPVSGTEILLNTKVENLVPQQLISISGKDISGKPVSEIATIARIEPQGAYTNLILKSVLQNSYQRNTALMNANVARATHGDTKKEVLGSGDGSKPFQKFQLKQKPLTYVSAATESGAESTLQVRVNDVLWRESPDLYDLEPNDRKYITRIADDGSVTIQTGDGITGARVPTGSENVSAQYRVGTGRSGMLDENQLNLLMSRPLGVKSVTNPLAPTGAEDPEKIEQARQNAPLTVVTLDRIVSLQDFETFARTFAGIGKAQSTWLWNGEKKLIHITIAGVDGDAVPPLSDLYSRLSEAIDSSRHADQRVRIDSYIPRLFNVEANILVDPDYIFENVKSAVEDALNDAFSFENRSFGQAITASEVISVIQKIQGVVAIDLDKLYYQGARPLPNHVLPAQIAHWESGQIKPAELLTINDHEMKITEMKP